MMDFAAIDLIGNGDMWGVGSRVGYLLLVNDIYNF